MKPARASRCSIGLWKDLDQEVTIKKVPYVTHRGLGESAMTPSHLSSALHAVATPTCCNVVMKIQTSELCSASQCYLQRDFSHHVDNRDSHHTRICHGYELEVCGTHLPK